MSDPQPPPPNQPSSEKPDATSSSAVASSSTPAADVKMEPPKVEEEPLPEDILNANPDEIATRTRMLENDIKIMRSENMRLMHEQSSMKEKIKDNSDKIKQNKVLPYLVGNVVEVSTRF